MLTVLIEYIYIVSNIKNFIKIYSVLLQKQQYFIKIYAILYISFFILQCSIIVFEHNRCIFSYKNILYFIEITLYC